MTNVAPFNLIGQVGDIYLAAVGTAFPAINAAPGGSWSYLGTAGSLDYDDDGVHIIGEQTISDFTGSGSTMKRKVWRTMERLTVTVKLVDMTLETLRRAFNNNAITTVTASSGIPGSKAINIYQGPDVATFAALIRTASPYSGDTGSFAQVELPNAFNAAGFDIAFVKGIAAGYTLTLEGMIDPANPSSAARAGRVAAYTAAAL
jgi:hypothetical protein